MGNFRRAIDDCTSLIQIDPKNATAYVRRAIPHKFRGESEKAIADLTAAIRYGETTRAYAERGFIYFDKGDYPNALVDLNNVLAVMPDAHTYIRRAYCYFIAGDTHAAVADLSQAVRTDPENGYAYFLRGQSYLRNGEKPKRRPIFSVREGLATRKVRRLRKGEDRRNSVRRTGRWRWDHDDRNPNCETLFGFKRRSRPTRCSPGWQRQACGEPCGRVYRQHRRNPGLSGSGWHLASG